MTLVNTFFLFLITAVAEILGCYFPYLVAKGIKPYWYLGFGAIFLAIFAWLLTLHPTSSGRIYAAYGGIYISVAMAWLWLVDGVKPTLSDLSGIALCLIGAGIIILGSK